MQAIDEYLAVRRAVGFRLQTTEYLLRSFAQFAVGRGEDHVYQRTAIDWAALAPSPEQRDRRLSVVRIFARHARAENDAHEIPPGHIFAHSRSRRRPYIFTCGGVRRLMEEAARLGPPGSLRPHTYRTMFGLMIAAGLRISEVLALLMDDVTPEGLLVRETKFRKSRLVPLHETTAAALEQYLERRRRIGGHDNHVFVSLCRRVPHYVTVNATFLALVRGIGLHPGPGKPGPRLHDLRHTFAVRALEACPKDQQSIARHMLALTTYMGHAHVAHTYWYLQITPQLMTDIADACGAFLEGGRP
jgi:integrase/recombinase XerD